MIEKTVAEQVRDFLRRNPQNRYASKRECARTFYQSVGISPSIHQLKRVGKLLSRLLEQGDINLQYTLGLSSSPDSMEQGEFNILYQDDGTDTGNSGDHDPLTMSVYGLEMDLVNGTASEIVETDKPPRTLEEAVKLANVDLRVWQISKFRQGTWGNSKSIAKGNLQFRVEYVRRVVSPELMMDNLLEKYSSITMPCLDKCGSYETGGDSFACVNFLDGHLDKIANKSTTGVEGSFDNNIEVYRRGVRTMVSKLSKYDLNKIYFPVGSDLFHVNNSANTTKKGTVMEYYCNQQDAYEKICELTIESVRMFSELAPVHAIAIAGNHDEDAVANMSFLLYKVFENTAGVTVDKTRTQRKYVKEGRNLIGFAHGDKEKKKIHDLPLIMAEEQKEWWGDTDHRQFYCGDLHHGFEYKFLAGKDFPGCSVKFLRSCGLSDDKWHVDHGYIGIPKTFNADIWDYEDGITDSILQKVK